MMRMVKQAVLLTFCFLIMVSVFFAVPKIDQARAASGNTFVNALDGGEDPFVYQHTDGFYYSAMVDWADTAIVVYKSPKLTDRGIRRTVWTHPAPGSWNSYDIWAPEIYFFDGHWYIYYAATDTSADVDQVPAYEHHRVGVLKSATSDVFSPYSDMGQLPLGNAMSLDPTLLRTDAGDLYLVFTQRFGSPEKSRTMIAPMSSPTTVSGAPVQISEPTYGWEGDINEGPEVIKKNGQISIIYSANAAHTVDYSLGQLKLSNSTTDQSATNILNPASWIKSASPVFAANGGNIYGPGHCSFVKSPDGTEDWIVYHSKFDTISNFNDPSTWNRVINIQKFTWNPDNTPNFGTPIDRGVPIALPSGESPNPIMGVGVNVTDTFDGYNDLWQEFGYYDRKSIRMENGLYSVDSSANAGVGDKAIIRDRDWSDFTIETDIRIAAGTVDGGVMFRARDVGHGVDTFKGYAATLNVNGVLVFGRSDGTSWTTLATAAQNVGTGWHHLKVVAIGNTFNIYVDDMANPKIANFTDNVYSRGSVGVRTVGTLTYYDNFSVTENFDPAKWYRLINKKSLRAASLHGGDTSQGTDLVLYNWLAASDQAWQFADVGGGYVKVINQKSGQAISIENGGTSNGSIVHIWPYLGGYPDQDWSIQPGSGGFAKLINRASGKALSTLGGGTDNDTPIHLWDYLGAYDDQDWAILEN